MLLTAQEYRESLRRYRPRVFVDGEAVESVADEPRLAPGIAAIGVTYDFATRPEYAEVMTAKQATSGRTVNRLAHLNGHTQDLLQKLEAVRLVCRESGCAQRYLTHDGLNALSAATAAADAEHAGTTYHDRFLEFLHRSRTTTSPSASP
jgi:4-hydroxybutyryl-CoA dehydratase/vinylacetyl-CoA-Delta-isomerase